MSIDIFVEAPLGSIHGTLSCVGLTVPCSLGRSGLGRDKHEGDGLTPVGRFPLRKVLYRADRMKPPVTKLPVSAIFADDGWCDDMGDKAYNQQVKLPYEPSHEELWRADTLYDLIVIIGYNDAPVVPGLGSAIFLHVRAPDAGATAGCVAIGLQYLLGILRALDAGSFIEIKAA